MARNSINFSVLSITISAKWSPYPYLDPLAFHHIFDHILISLYTEEGAIEHIGGHLTAREGQPNIVDSKLLAGSSFKVNAILTSTEGLLAIQQEEMRRRNWFTSENWVHSDTDLLTSWTKLPVIYSQGRSSSCACLLPTVFVNTVKHCVSLCMCHAVSVLSQSPVCGSVAFAKARRNFCEQTGVRFSYKMQNKIEQH